MAIGFHRNSGKPSVGGQGTPTVTAAGPAPVTLDGVTELPELVVTARPKRRWYDPLVDLPRHAARSTANFLAGRPAGDHYYGLPGGGFRSGNRINSQADLRSEQARFASKTRQAAPRLALGEVNNLSNTVLGVAYGLGGHVVGGLRGTHPRISLTPDGIEFIRNPWGGVGALTIGRATTYRGDPYDRSGQPDPYDPGARTWYWKDGSPRTDDGNPVHLHEAAHRRQGDQLGPIYLPSNIAGGLSALARDKDWHGPSNWNEVGPQMNPPRPWPERR